MDDLIRDKIGVLGPESLIDTLANSGARVVGGPSFVTAALDLRQRPDSGEVFPLLLVRQNSAGFDKWVQRHALSTRTAMFGSPVPEGVTEIGPGQRLADVVRGLGMSVAVDESIIFTDDGDLTVAQRPAPERTGSAGASSAVPHRLGGVGSGHESVHSSPPVGAGVSGGGSAPSAAGAAEVRGASPVGSAPPAPAPPVGRHHSIHNSNIEETTADFANASLDTMPQSIVPVQPPAPPSAPPAPPSRPPMPQSGPAGSPSPQAPRPGSVGHHIGESLVAGEMQVTDHGDHTDLFGDDDPYTDRRRGQMADMLIAYARKGGVGKTTEALALANRAANRGLRTVLIDGNRGQGDLRSILRLMKNRMPSVFDAAVSGDYARAIIPPSTLNRYRPDNLEEVRFAFVSAPPVAELTDPTLVTAEVYRRVVAEARARADLVIFDTQIVEAHDTTGIIDRLVIPELRAGAWGLGLCDLSLSGLKNLVEYNKTLMTRHGVKRDRLLIALNRIFPETPYRQEVMQRQLSPAGIFLGAVQVDPMITDQVNRGHIPGDGGVFDEMLDAVLYRVTGREEFDPDIARARNAALAKSKAPRRRGFLGLGRKSRS